MRHYNTSHKYDDRYMRGGVFEGAESLTMEKLVRWSTFFWSIGPFIGLLIGPFARSLIH